jgi:chemotaxis protein CheC
VGETQYAATLTAQELTRLRTLCDAAIANISRGLTEMFGATMRITALDVRTLPLAEAGTLLGDPEAEVVGIYLGSQGLFAAHLLLVMSVPVALELCDVLLELPSGESKAIGELEASALCEMGNVAGSFFLNALSERTGNTLLITPPLLLHDMAGVAIAAVLIDVAATADETVMIDAGFKHEGRSLPAWFLTFPEPAQLHELLRPLENVA